MSEIQRETGTLFPVRGDAEIMAGLILKSRGNIQSRTSRPSKDNKQSYLEELFERYPDEYVLVDDVIHTVRIKTENLDSDIFRATKNNDGTIGFMIQFYNGGCSTQEALQRALQTLE